MVKYDLNEVGWRVIEPLHPNKPRGVPWPDDRPVTDGIVYVLRTGSPRRDLPGPYGPHMTVCNRLNRRARAGVWVRVFEALSAPSPGSMHSIDTSIIRAHPHGAGGTKAGPDHAIGRSRGGPSTKINALADQDGLPLRIVLPAGQASDTATVKVRIDGLKSALARVADRGYDARAVIDPVPANGDCTHIPTQKDRRVKRSIDPAICRQRNVVERDFCKLEHFRRIATRFDKRARIILAAGSLASNRLWLKAHESRTQARRTGGKDCSGNRAAPGPDGRDGAKRLSWN